MNARRFGPAIILALLLAPQVFADSGNVIRVKMHRDPKHSMIAIDCRINGAVRRYACVIDSGATRTIVSEKILKAEGPATDVTTANGVIHVHEREVLFTLAEGLDLKSRVFVQSESMPADVEVLLGQDVLRQFRSVIFDYENEQVEFRR